MTQTAIHERLRLETGKGRDRRPVLGFAGVVVCVLFAAAVVVTLDYDVPPSRLKVEQRAPVPLVARVTFSYLDPDWLNKQRSQAADEVPYVFRGKDQWRTQVTARLEELCSIAESAPNADRAADLAGNSQMDQVLVRQLYAFEHQGQTKVLRRLLLEPINESLSSLVQEGVLSEIDYKDALQHWALYGRLQGKPNPEILKLSSTDTARDARLATIDLTNELSVARNERLFRVLAARGLPAELQSALRNYFITNFTPSLVKDDEVRRKLKEKARAAVPDTEREIKEGDLLLGEGEQVTAEDLRKLKAHARAFKALLPLPKRILNLLGLATLAAASIFLFVLLLRRLHPGAFRRRSGLLSLALANLAVLVTAKALFYSDLSGQLVPVAFVSVIASLAVSQGAAIATSVLLSVLVGFAAGGNSALTLALMTGGIVAALPARHLQSRWDLLRYGLYGGLAQGAVVAGLSLIDVGGTYTPFLPEARWGLLNGIACGLLLTALLPLIEVLFGIITNIRLFELSDINRPALRKIMLEAPGTWAHTLQVAFLAEPAAEAIGANARLVRAGVYYHDLGKTLKPEYFAENQMDAEARHKRLAPSVSALIITGHVKDGIELAREFGLPQQIMDFIPEHHGTTLVRYFFHTAKKKAEESEPGGGGEQVEEAFFRYPGPKPQSRETAVVMLADTIEAATRTLEAPSATRLRTFVHELIMEKLLDGQFDECEITFRDLATVEEVFLRVLVSRFHQRPLYPDQEGEPPKSPRDETQGGGAPSGSHGGGHRHDTPPPGGKPKGSGDSGLRSAQNSKPPSDPKIPAYSRDAHDRRNG